MVMKSLFLDDYRNLPGSDRKAQNSAQHQRQLPGVDTVLRSLRGHLRRRWVRRVQEHSALPWLSSQLSTSPYLFSIQE